MSEELTSSASIDASIYEGEPYPIRNFKGRRYKADPAARKRRHGLSCHELPAGCSYVKTLVTQFRKKLEEALIKLKGEISIFDAALVNTAARSEQHALLAARWLREGFAEMTWDQRLNTSREIVKGSLDRDKALRLLNVDRSAGEDLRKDYRHSLDLAIPDPSSPTADPADPPTSPEPAQ